MSDGQTFIFVLAALYIWESVFWVLPNSFGWTRFLKTWKPYQARDLLYGRQKAILFNPWPGILFPQCLGSELPFHLTKDRLILPEGRYLNWEDLKLNQEAADLYLVEDYKLKLPNALYAGRLLNLLRDFKESNPDQRERNISLFHQFHFSPTRVSRLVFRAKAITSLLRLNGLILTLLFFGAIPYSYITRKETVFPYLLLFSLIFIIYQAIVAFFTVKRLDAKSKRHRWVICLSTLFPWQAMHVGQQLLSQSLPLQHPLAVSAALCNTHSFKKQLSTYWRRLSFSKEAPPPQPFLDALKDFMQQQAVNPDTLLAPPAKMGNETASYCPCCHAQYRENFTTCTDCRGVELVPFKRI